MKKAIVFSLLLISYFFNAQTNLQHVDAPTFKKLMLQKEAVLIDLRTNDELINKGKIKGATQIDFFSKTAEAQIEKLDKNKTYLLYCAGGGRSGECAELMQKLGFKNIVNLEKGFDDWKRKGFEVETISKK